MENTLKIWFYSFVHLFFPRCCVVCGTPLVEGEEMLCTCCNIDLPRTGYHLQENNPVERMFWGKFPLVRATSYFFYRKGSDFRRILHELKYGGKKNIGTIMGRFIATELAESLFLKDVDIIVPVPLHPRKQKVRGYNQTEYIARGVSEVSGIPLDASSVVRVKFTETQTHKSLYERSENVDGVFRVFHPEHFTGKHILIVDDVLTTGATTTACADAFRGIQGIQISVLTLAVAE